MGTAGGGGCTRAETGILHQQGPEPLANSQRPHPADPLPMICFRGDSPRAPGAPGEEERARADPARRDGSNTV